VATADTIKFIFLHHNGSSRRKKNVTLACKFLNFSCLISEKKGFVVLLPDVILTFGEFSRVCFLKRRDLYCCHSNTSCVVTVCTLELKPLCDKASTHGVKFHESITTLMAAWNDHSRISEASVQSFCNKLTQNKQQGKLRSNLADQTHWIKQQGNLGEIHSRFHCHRCTHANTTFQMIFYLQHRH